MRVALQTHEDPSDPDCGVRAETVRSTSLIRESVFLSIIMGLANLANVIFQILMGRWLTASDYGVLMAMIG
ncbi:MAG: hypothetical protein PHP44_08265, partial [Kiritimatiellae bacterium]|nr:hypothetical protein [Kiritimatiellia bacterium]